MSRLLLKFVQQASLVEQATRRWPAVQGRGWRCGWPDGPPGPRAGSVIASGPRASMYSPGSGESLAPGCDLLDRPVAPRRFQRYPSLEIRRKSTPSRRRVLFRDPVEYALTPCPVSRDQLNPAPAYGRRCGAARSDSCDMMAARAGTTWESVGPSRYDREARSYTSFGRI